MSDILTDYREWQSQQEERIGTHSPECHLWHDRCMIHRLAAEVERLRLTDAEREAIGRAASFADDAAGYCREPENADAARTQAATLRGLLERTARAGIRNAARG